jgi:hypothetical protein
MEAIRQAKEAAEEILEMTKALVLTGAKEREEEEVEAYALLMDEREPLINELADLREQIDGEERETPEFAEVVQIILEITALDKKNAELMERVRESIQLSYKGVKQGQRISAGYNPLQGDEASITINIKQ